MKVYTTLLLAALAGVLAYAMRRRLKLAFTVAAVAYLVIMPVRVALAAGNLGERAEELFVLAAGVLLGWAVLWRVSVWFERRKLARRAASPAPRTSGWRRLRR